MIWLILLLILISGLIYLTYTSKWIEIFDIFFKKQTIQTIHTTRSPSPSPRVPKLRRFPQPQTNSRSLFRNNIVSSSTISQNNSYRNNSNLNLNMNSYPKFINTNQNNSPTLSCRNYNCDNHTISHNILYKNKNTVVQSNINEKSKGFHYYSVAYEDYSNLPSGYKFIQERLKTKNNVSDDEIETKKTNKSNDKSQNRYIDNNDKREVEEERPHHRRHKVRVHRSSRSRSDDNSENNRNEYIRRNDRNNDENTRDESHRRSVRTRHKLRVKRESNYSNE
ncbi:hypothetical protein M9Y10_011367 [Tritrichomonas musculus]|uniref:Uncharacterized protein n=1 Tax=Tritrichomonas musculus TaxID=1915356 RepID=A0ABR2ILH6_9EUKA